MVFNLDENFNPHQATQVIQFESFLFSGGEPHIKINPDFDHKEPISLTHRLNSFQDVGLLCLAVDALRRLGVKEINLFIPYFPAARQDRVMVAGEPLSVKVYADIINALHLDSVTIYDAHSEVAPALLERCINIPNHDFIQKVVEKIGKEVVLISPDGGALKKIYKVSEAIGDIEVVECSKTREVKTGKLSGFKVYKDDLEGKDCLIVDDICDGGGTFIGLAEALNARNAGNLYLAVSHGIFSKGLDALGGYFTEIFTTDSVREIEHEKLTQIKL
jgi:ribose-phosphate pyrophosphokinase